MIPRLLPAAARPGNQHRAVFIQRDFHLQPGNHNFSTVGKVDIRILNPQHPAGDGKGKLLVEQAFALGQQRYASGSTVAVDVGGRKTAVADLAGKLGNRKGQRA
ncbi:MAG: hypothetical protein BWY71_01171 [Planctomycetes bacterium ADurb.Bin412]|nr:MAG: hypothetical protein BWY71_01171 [Planctomycetes bacterium ADurb.Bin412]